MAPSYLAYLRHEGMIISKRNEQGFLYSLANPQLLSDAKSKYKMRFIDKSINNFIDMVDKL